MNSQNSKLMPEKSLINNISEYSKPRFNFMVFYIKFYLVIMVLLSSCKPKNEVKISGKEDSIARFYHEGKLQTEFKMKNGIKEGIGKIYYLNGKLSSTCDYVKDLKNGTESKYYYDGSLYREREYSMGVINGIEKRFYRNGQIKTHLYYKDGMPGKGLKEYSINGNLKTEYPEFVWKVIYNRDYGKQKLLLFYFSDYCKNVYYYEGSLIEGKYFNGDAILCGNQDGVGEIALYPDFSGEIVISSKYVTPNRAPYIVEKKIKVEPD